MRLNVKDYLQDSIWVDNFPTVLCLFVTKLGWVDALCWPPQYSGVKGHVSRSKVK